MSSKRMKDVEAIREYMARDMNYEAAEEAVSRLTAFVAGVQELSDSLHGTEEFPIAYKIDALLEEA
jgi:hypothetical protein